MNTSAKSGLFLIEMIIAIAVFAVAAAICTRLFVSAHVVSSEAREANMAVLTAQSVAEVFKATDGSAQETAEFFGTGISNGEDRFFIALDSSWEVISQADTQVSYIVLVTVDESSPVKKASIAVSTRKGFYQMYHDDISIFNIEVKHYSHQT